MAWAQAHQAARPRIASAVSLLGSRRPTASTRVGEEPSPGRPARYSTAELVAIEQAALALVERGLDAQAPSIPIETLDETERAAELVLSEEQEAMVRAVATSPSRVVCVVGLAGAGKTTATRRRRPGLRATPASPVLGAAPSGVAAEKLQDETGIPATTLHRLLEDSRTDGACRPARCS